MSPDLHHLSGAYAVDALDDAERTSFEQHLAVCADCRAEVAELSATAHSLTSLTEAAPPPSLRASVLSGIARVRPLPPLTEDAADAGSRLRSTWHPPLRPLRPLGAPVVAEVATAETAQRHETEPDAGGTVVPIRRRPRTAWFAAAAAAAVIAIGGLAWSPWSDDAGSLSPMAQVAAAADAMRVSSSKGGVTTEVAYSKQLGKAAITVQRPAARTRGARPTSSGTSGPTVRRARPGCSASTPTAAVRRSWPGDASRRPRSAMTVEPTGGSIQPTTDPLVVLASPDRVSGAQDRRRDGLEHRHVTGIRAVGSRPVGDDVGEPELGRPPGHLGVEVDRLQGVARRGVEQEVAVERARGPAARTRRRTGRTSVATWSNHSSTVSPLPP